MNVPLVLSVEPANPTVIAGTETHAFLKLENETAIVLNLVLVVDETQAGWIVPTPNTIEVAPNGQATAALVLRPSADASPAPFLITVLARNLADGSEMARVSFAVTVEPAALVVPPGVAVPAAVAALAATPELLLTASLTAQTSPDSADYMIQVGNPTATLLTADLVAVDETNRLKLVIDPAQVILPAQGQANAILHVTAISPLSGDEPQRTYTFAVQARAGEGVQPTQATATFVQTQVAGAMSKLPLILALIGVGLVLLALLWFFLNQRNQGITTLPTVSPLPATAIPTQVPIVLTAVPLPTLTPLVLTAVPLPTLPPPSPIVLTAVPLPTLPPASPIVITVVPPSPVVVTATALPPTAVPATPTMEPFAVTAAVVSVQPQTSAECPTAFLFSAQVTANGPGSVQFQWEFSNGQNPPPAVMEFTAAGTSVAQTSLPVTESQEGWGRVQFINPVFEPSNQAEFVLNCPPATTTP